MISIVRFLELKAYHPMRASVILRPSMR